MVRLKSHCFEKIWNVFAVNSGPLSQMTTLAIPYLEKKVFRMYYYRGGEFIWQLTDIEKVGGIVDYG